MLKALKGQNGDGYDVQVVESIGVSLGHTQWAGAAQVWVDWMMQ